MLDGFVNALSETKNAITSDTDRMIGIFAIPLIAVFFLTAAQYTVLINASHAAIFSSLTTSGICNTYQPYLITSVMGSFQGDPYAHVGECQAVSFNPLVFAAWYAELFAILMIAIFVFESITHLG